MNEFSLFELNTINDSWKQYNKNITHIKDDIKKIRVCIYLRKSTEDIKDNSLKLQLNEIEKFVVSINENYKNEYYFYYDDEDIYSEDNVSGMQGRNRPEFDRMLKTIEINNGYYGVCIVYKLDRFSRKLEDTLKYSSLLKINNCVLKALDFEDHGDPTSDLLNNILGVVAQYHAQNSALTSIKGTIKKVEENKAVGLLPYGLTTEKNKLGNFNFKGASKIVIEEDKAKVVKEIYEKFSEGYSISEIERYLIEKGVTKDNGNFISWQQIYYMLRNKRYNGTYVYADHKKVVKRKYDNGVRKPDYYEKKNAFPKIIEDTLFNKVQLIINSQNKTHRLTEGSVTYFLTGLITCGCCGRQLHGMSRSKYKGKKYYDYGCPTHKYNKTICTTKRINKQYLENFIFEILISLLENIIRNNQTVLIKNIERKLSNIKDTISFIDNEIIKRKKILYCYE